MFFNRKSIDESSSSSPLLKCIDTVNNNPCTDRVKNNPGTTMLVISHAFIISGIVMLLLPQNRCVDEKEETPTPSDDDSDDYDDYFFDCSYNTTATTLLIVGVVFLLLPCICLKPRDRELKDKLRYLPTQLGGDSQANDPIDQQPTPF